MKTRTAPSLRQRLSIALFTGAATLALLAALLPASGHAQEHGAPAAPHRQSAAGAVTTQPVAPSSEVTTSPVKTPATPEAAPVRVEGGSNTISTQIKDAMNGGEPTGKQLNIIIDKNSSSSGVAPGTPPPKNPGAAPQGAKPAASAQMRKAEQQGRAMAQANPRNASGIVIRAKALPQAKKPEPKPKEPPLPEHWAYSGPGGPQNWHKLKPEYALCGSGKTQSPIAIQDDDTLKGPAEPLLFNYKPSKGTVTDTGHGIQVKVYNTDNVLSVRNTKYRLQQFHFHAPAEETINGQSFPLGAHFVHKNDMGQLAVVTMLFETGEPNPLIENVWTHMPLGENDSVRMPPDLVNINEILPQDTRYYSYFGSLTTPPCTEGVLWLVLKQPVQISPEQLHMYTQLYDHTARPVQPRNGRTIRDAILLIGDVPAAKSK